MTAEVNTINEKKPRLKFIDMARSLAILLMLEGHFTGAALSNAYRKEDFLLFKIWHNIHGLTSPLFFTVTGVVFVYLLSANNDIAYFNNIRVRKGFKRVGQLIFWGYFIQLNIWGIIQSIYYGSAFHLEWFYAFHVLQSIGVGILFLLLIYGVYKWINKGALYWYYLIGGLILFTGYSYMKNYIQIDELLVKNEFKNTPSYWPNGAPSFVQNMFYGKYSDFSFLRYSGYTILGGMLGNIIRLKESKTREWWYGTIFIVAGLFLSIFIQPILHSFDHFTNWIHLTKHGVYELNATAFIRFGQVVSLLGIFMLIDKYIDVKAKLYLKIGQNTFPIYVVHVIILYGGIFGFGLKPLLFDENLSPWLAACISLVSILFFALMVYFIEPLENLYTKVLGIFSFKRKAS